MSARQRDTGPAEAATLLQPTRPRARETPDTADTATADRNVVQLANRKIDQAFRRLGYRTSRPHAALGLPAPVHRMLRWNAEDTGQDQLKIIIGELAATGPGAQILARWIVREELRHLLALRFTKTHTSPRPAPSVTGWPPSTSPAPALRTFPKSPALHGPSANGSNR